MHRGGSVHNPPNSKKGSGSNRGDPKGSLQKAGSGVSAFKVLLLFPVLPVSPHLD